MVERKSAYISFMSSLAFHALICLLYLYLVRAREASMLLLENIELIEIEPDAHIVEEMPRQRPPKTVLDFIKMALPSFKKPKFQEIAEPEVEREIIELPSEKIDLEKTMEVRSKPQISLTQKKYERGEKIHEIIPKEELDKRERLAMLSAQEPAIDIAEVGKVAVRETSFSQPISLEKKALSSTLKDFKKIKIGKEKKSYKSLGFKETGVSIKKRRPTSGKPSIGYGKGISLTKHIRKPLARPSQKPKISEPVTQKIEKTTSGMIREAKPDKKSVEIMGPVVGRKILTSYLPIYPDWAKAENIEADVVIRFYVSPEGMVREKLYLERTSGYSRLDKLAMEALKKWAFEPSKTPAGDQWGIITFRYLLK